MKHLVFTVTNALNYDQRMQRICTSLVQAGYRVTLVGWCYPNSPALSTQLFEQVRLPMKFESGKFRYAEYNWKLFQWLKKNDFDLICAIDLDSIIPCLKISRRKNIPIVYDAHEYFTELEEVVRRPFIKWVWQQVEKYAVPKIKNGYAVNDSYVNLFKQNYGVDYLVIRNATVLQEFVSSEKKEKYILYQGAVNEGRGLHQLIEAMQTVDCNLLICGKGDYFDELITYTKALHLENKITFKGFVAPADLKQITRDAIIGITLFDTKGLSNYYSLANRFFDYLHAGVPQLCTAYPEYIAINNQFQLAVLIDEVSATKIADSLNQLLTDETLYSTLHHQALKARLVYNWQEEEKKLVAFYKKIFL